MTTPGLKTTAQVCFQAERVAGQRGHVLPFPDQLAFANKSVPTFQSPFSKAIGFYKLNKDKGSWV
jgi:hypothetical protein